MRSPAFSRLPLFLRLMASGAGHRADKSDRRLHRAIDVTPLFVALDKGYFQKRGLEINPQLMAVNPLIPPALVSD